MKSDFAIDAVLFDPKQITESTIEVCNVIAKNDAETASIFGNIVEMRKLESPPAADVEFIDVPSREPGRLISCRAVTPTTGKPKGVFLHFHGGAMSIGTHYMNDAHLQRLADASNCVTVSVGYRLAPEHTFPKGIQDSFDVADQLLNAPSSLFGVPLHFIGGESAGAHLAIQTYFHLAGTNTELPTLKGLVLSYGSWSWSWLPSSYFPDMVCLDPPKLSTFREIYISGAMDSLPTLCNELEGEFGILASKKENFDRGMKHPALSPLYRELSQLRGHLPPALFLCGTADPLLDDSILMSAHWQMTGGQATVRFVPGAPHAFVEMPIELGGCCAQGVDIIAEYIGELSP